MVKPRVKIVQGDALTALARIPDASVDAVVTDPPYLLGFMGKAWDTRPAHEHLAWHGAWAAECLRVLKPGGHLLAFGGTRTSHRLAVAVEDAGFEIRDTITWLYGSGFPKSLDVGKAIDKAAGATREVVGVRRSAFTSAGTGVGGQAREHQAAQGYRPDGAPYPSELNVDEKGYKLIPMTAPETPEAQQWHGWGTALKPASEPIVVARKPLAGTVAANVLAHGTGALNIDGCRVGTDVVEAGRSGRGQHLTSSMEGGALGVTAAAVSVGRWPANVVLDEAAAQALDADSGTSSSPASYVRATDADANLYGHAMGDKRAGAPAANYGDTGGASRFFPVFKYQAKAPTRERPSYVREDGRKVAHPTVKPLELMRWLVRLVTPPGGLVLDPFAGSGTTGEAAWLEGFSCHLIENDPEAIPLIRQRMQRLRGRTPRQS